MQHWQDWMVKWLKLTIKMASKYTLEGTNMYRQVFYQAVCMDKEKGIFGNNGLAVNSNVIQLIEQEKLLRMGQINAN